MEATMGIILVIVGAIVTYRGVHKDDSNMPGIKARMLIVGMASIFFGIIIMFR